MASIPDDPRDDTKTKIQFTPDIATTRWLALRGYLADDPLPLSRQAKRELGVMRSILNLEMARIRLTLPEACALAGVLANMPFSFDLGGRLGIAYQEMYDAIKNAREDGRPLGERVGFDEDKLLAKLADLGPAADMALRQAIADWAKDEEHLSPDVESFARAGLRIAPNAQDRAA